MKPNLIALTVVLAVLITSCGSDADGGSSGAETTTSTMMAMVDEFGDDLDMSDMNMGDPNATPASEVEDADLETGEFELLPTRPDGYADATGEAAIARSDAGTTVTVDLSGLKAGVEYDSHLHEGACEDNGGEHFKFDPYGDDQPPNEIHLVFTSDDDGNGTMTAENDRTAGPEGQSVVVHEQDDLDKKIVCAQFSV